MSHLLGDLLVESGKLSEAQLSSALDRQIKKGGRIGTSIVELGYLSRNELAEFLSRKLNIPCAYAEDLESVPEEVIRLIPSDIAERHHLIPFRKDGMVLSIAMRDPTDLEAISEVSFRTGCLINAHVTSEIQIHSSLERYYSLPSPFACSDPPPHQEVVNGGGLEFEMTPEETETKNFHEALERVKKDFAYASNREEVIASLMNVLSSVFDRILFFISKKQAMTGWMGMAPGLSKTQVSDIEVPLGKHSVFDTVWESQKASHGPLSMTEGNERFIQKLGGSFPEDMIAVPLVIQNQIIGILYGDNLLSKSPITCFSFVKVLAEKAALSLEILILRKKILEQ